MKELIREVYNELYSNGFTPTVETKLRSLFIALDDFKLDYDCWLPAICLTALIQRSRNISEEMFNRSVELELRLLRRFFDFDSTLDETKTTTVWNNAEEMFGEKAMLTTPDGGRMTLQELKASNLKTVDIPVVRPSNEIIAEEYNLRYYNDGHVEKVTKYQVQPLPVFGDDELWSNYMQKALNNILESES